MSVTPRLSKVTSYAQSFTKTLSKEFEKRTQRAAKVLADEHRKNLSTPGNGRPSTPSEFPRMQSGGIYRGVKTVVVKRSPYTVRLVNKAPYNDAVDSGARGGTIIKPVTAKSLAFKVFTAGGIGAATVFAKSVKKGRLKGRHQTSRTLEGCREKIRKIYTRGVDELKRTGNKAIVRLS